MEKIEKACKILDLPHHQLFHTVVLSDPHGDAVNDGIHTKKRKWDGHNQTDIYLKESKEKTKTWLKEAYRRVLLRYHPDKQTWTDKSDAERYYKIGDSYQFLLGTIQELFTKEIPNISFASQTTIPSSIPDTGKKCKTSKSNSEHATKSKPIKITPTSTNATTVRLGSSAETEREEMMKIREKEKWRYKLLRGYVDEMTRKTLEIRLFVRVTLEECFRGVKEGKEVLFERMEICSCSVSSHASSFFPGGHTTNTTNRNNSSGNSNKLNPKTTCSSCKGTGHVIRERSVCVQIPPGAAAGDRIVFRGHSHRLKDTVSGDVIVTVVEKKHPVYHREGSTLRVRIPIDLAQYLEGFSCYLPMIDGRIAHIKIGSMQSVVILSGRGMPVTGKSTAVRGNVAVYFTIRLPTN